MNREPMNNVIKATAGVVHEGNTICVPIKVDNKLAIAVNIANKEVLSIKFKYLLTIDVAEIPLTTS
jgi:hypothetical protein